MSTSVQQQQELKNDYPNLKIDQQLQKFYAQHNVELSGIRDSFPHRFIRLNPRYDKNETLRILREELGDNEEPIPVSWLDADWGFHALPPNFALSGSPSFKSGRVYGMDVSSGAAAASLLSEIYDKNKASSFLKQKLIDSKEQIEIVAEEKESIVTSNISEDEIRVLDLCCCPGLKLCMIADQLRSRQKQATVVGVDVSELRMALCKKIVNKYQIDVETCGSLPEEGTKIQLYCQDGTSFGIRPQEINLVFDSRSALEEMKVRGKRKKMNKSARARERKRLKLLASTDWASNNDDDDDATTEKDMKPPMIKPFDYVLVDSECSTDASLKHMKERLKSNGLEKNIMLTDETKLADLVDLQKRLIESGFRLLKGGGTMVYSTCSLSYDQNEKVVQWLLDTKTDAFLIPVHFPMAKSKLVIEGSLPGSVRFYPNVGQNSTEFFGDGFFLAKLGKR
jgi:16S rRNA C967 or C1407 C5-methylase (RsmB/RsmF family)